MHISQLSVAIEKKHILHDINVVLSPGSVHVLMGPNGSGKSTLVYALAGHPAYTIISGEIRISEIAVHTLSLDMRARAGLFVSFQYPCVVPGVRLITFLKEAIAAVTGESLSVTDVEKRAAQYCELLHIDRSFLFRPLHDGFSGGERKRCELLQMLLLKPKVAVLDEIDSGLDVDALNYIAHALHCARQENPHLTILLITHYQHILEYIVPDQVHVMMAGKLVSSGDYTVAQTIAKQGFDDFKQENAQ